MEVVVSSASPLVCCGEEMTLLKANTTDGAAEKHVPAVTIDGNAVKVQVGSAAHPMEETHWIQFIAMETTQGVYRKNLNPADKPCAEFALSDGEKAVAVYEFCNKHGFWKIDL